MNWSLILLFLLALIGLYVYNNKESSNQLETQISCNPIPQQIGGGWPNPCLLEQNQGMSVGPITVGKNADSFFFSPPDITGSCQRYGSPYPDRSSLIGISNTIGDCSSPKVANLEKIIHPGKVDQIFYYDNPCLTKPPYGTKTAGLEYMMKLPELNNELYRNCDEYGCPSQNPFNRKPDSELLPRDYNRFGGSKNPKNPKNRVKGVDKVCEPLPALARTCAFTHGSVSPSLVGTGLPFGGDAADTMSRNDITEEMYHNPTAYCAKNPNHPRCAIFSGLFTPFIGPVEYKNSLNEVVGDGLIPMDKVFPIPRPNQSNVDGFCLETNPFCTIDDTRSVTILQSQMMDPRC